MFLLTGCNGISTIAAPIQITSRLSISLFRFAGNDSNLLIVFYVQIMPD
ncbi:aldehyde dehydrogenase, partial [Shigella flexneri]